MVNSINHHSDNGIYQTANRHMVRLHRCNHGPLPTIHPDAQSVPQEATVVARKDFNRVFLRAHHIIILLIEPANQILTAKKDNRQSYSGSQIHQGHFRRAFLPDLPRRHREPW